MCFSAFGTWTMRCTIDARRDDVVGIDLARLDQVLDLGDRDLAGGRHHRIEVARGLAVDEVALGVALPGVHDREVGDEAALHDVVLAVELALLLALGDHGADAGLGEEGRDAGAAGADALGQRALRVELDLELAGEKLLREHLVLADVGRDHLLDLARSRAAGRGRRRRCRHCWRRWSGSSRRSRGSPRSGSRGCRTGRSRRP